MSGGLVIGAKPGGRQNKGNNVETIIIAVTNKRRTAWEV
jgi:hypothetical protein